MTTHYVYRKSEGEKLWTSGFFTPEGEWIPEHDCESPEEAAMRCAWLNGGEKPKVEKIPGLSYAEGIAKVQEKWPKRYFVIEVDATQRTGEEAVEIHYAGRVAKVESGSGWDRYVSNVKTFAEVVAVLTSEEDAPKLAEQFIEWSVE